MSIDGKIRPELSFDDISPDMDSLLRLARIARLMSIPPDQGWLDLVESLGFGGLSLESATTLQFVQDGIEKLYGKCERFLHASNPEEAIHLVRSRLPLRATLIVPHPDIEGGVLAAITTNVDPHVYESYRQLLIVRTDITERLSTLIMPGARGDLIGCGFRPIRRPKRTDSLPELLDRINILLTCAPDDFHRHIRKDRAGGYTLLGRLAGSRAFLTDSSNCDQKYTDLFMRQDDELPLEPPDPIQLDVDYSFRPARVTTLLDPGIVLPTGSGEFSYRQFNGYPTDDGTNLPDLDTI